VLAGCSFSAVADAQDASEAVTSQSALVTVERTQDGTKTEVVARVLRGAERGPVDEAALRLAGFPEELPALGTCAAASQAVSAPATRGLELVDLGQVAVELSDGTRTPLVARHVPDPAGVLSGVMYNARISDPERAPSAEPARVIVRAAGNAQDPDALSFVALVSVPHDLTDVRLAGVEPREWAAVPGPVELTWAAGDGEAIVAIDVRAADGRTTSRCTFADAGRASLSLPSDEGSLVLHRVQRERFRLDGRDAHKGQKSDGEIRFDTARVVTLSRNARTR